MEDFIKTIEESTNSQDAVPASNDESPRLQDTKNVQKLIPRHQNKMVAERTSDMFMSGLMCE
jgi:hypothetical protein